MFTRKPHRARPPARPQPHSSRSPENRYALLRIPQKHIKDLKEVTGRLVERGIPFVYGSTGPNRYLKYDCYFTPLYRDVLELSGVEVETHTAHGSTCGREHITIAKEKSLDFLIADLRAAEKKLGAARVAHVDALRKVNKARWP